MRNGQNNKRMRNRNNGNNNNNNRRGQNPLTRVFESNGPDIKIRGTASHVAEKYVQLARDARSSGDPVAAENYYQHAEHYFRLIAAAQEQFRQNQPQPRAADDLTVDDLDDDGESFSHFGQEPGFVQPQPQAQPFMRDRDGGQRERGDNQQPYQRDQQQPREHREAREHRQPREHREPREAREHREPREQREPQEHREREQRERPQPAQYQPQPQPVVADSGVDRLPSFITGPQPQIANAPAAFEGGAERYPRRRRRPHGPRAEAAAAAPVPSEDINPGE
ncbi:conserved protein of unknown function [Bradyrhizobium sp. ORS 285]|uniref:DUF4167 domain-containing protein n=1 Tax=Bradyrhizobium sp. ORS 285 TaxID=115808 RepID=UPI0002406CE9|nr:DUF4167 domain-containing protein [Bradyrhizobium sp. ORS 285]CCD84914.1 conserved hypothetical protein [Bradyrhizobium sp. ORS 285]SMX55384.1 conserved protein of unknown function [Bradyrhizobium sp. ORS 285]